MLIQMSGAEMAISEKLADSELSKSKKNEEGKEKTITALGQLQRQGLTLIADVVHQIREQAQSQGLYNADPIKRLVKARLHHSGNGLTSSTIMFLDPKHDEEITKFLKPGIRAFSEGREFEGLTNIEKLDALVYAMRDEDYFKINYVRHDPEAMPQTVEETFSSKQGDCDELSRLYVALASELEITGLMQVYIGFYNTENGERDGHAALFFIDGQMLYIDSGFENAHLFEKKYASPEEAMKDPELEAELSGLQRKARRGSTWIIEERVVMKNASPESTYYLERASYERSQRNWGETIIQANNAIQHGMDNSTVYFELGQAYYQSNDDDNAIAALRKAVERKKSDPRYYSFLGDSYSRKGLHVAAAEAFREQIRLQPANVEATFDLVTELKDAGKSAMSTHNYANAVKYYGEAERILSGVLKNEHATDVDKAAAEALLPEVKQDLQNARRKNN